MTVITGLATGRSATIGIEVGRGSTGGPSGKGVEVWGGSTAVPWWICSWQHHNGWICQPRDEWIQCRRRWERRRRWWVAADCGDDVIIDGGLEMGLGFIFWIFIFFMILLFTCRWHCWPPAKKKKLPTGVPPIWNNVDFYRHLGRGGWLHRLQKSVWPLMKIPF